MRTKHKRKKDPEGKTYESIPRLDDCMSMIVVYECAHASYVYIRRKRGGRTHVPYTSNIPVGIVVGFAVGSPVGLRVGLAGGEEEALFLHLYLHL